MWEAFLPQALHHARDPTESANEDMRIDKIVADLRDQFQGSNPGVLSESGKSLTDRYEPDRTEKGETRCNYEDH